MLKTIVVLLALALVGCGGGSDFEDEPMAAGAENDAVRTPRNPCVAQPERCR